MLAPIGVQAIIQRRHLLHDLVAPRLKITASPRICEDFIHLRIKAWDRRSKAGRNVVAEFRIFRQFGIFCFQTLHFGLCFSDFLACSLKLLVSLFYLWLIKKCLHLMVVFFAFFNRDVVLHLLQFYFCAKLLEGVDFSHHAAKLCDTRIEDVPLVMLSFPNLLLQDLPCIDALGIIRHNHTVRL